MAQFENHIPMDRRQAMAFGYELPRRATGAALFADLSGFGRYTELLAKELMPNQGAQELMILLNRIYTVLVDRVDAYRGSVISFSGDALTCWFEDDDGRRALRSGLEMQASLQRNFASVSIPSVAEPLKFTLKIAVVPGTVSRFVVGNPDIQRIDVMAGATLNRLAAAEKVAISGQPETVVPMGLLTSLGLTFANVQHRQSPKTGEHFEVLVGVQERFHMVGQSGWPVIPPDRLLESQTQAWLTKSIYERLSQVQAGWLAEIRSAVSLFLGFEGIDYDADPEAQPKLDQYIRWVQQVLARYGGHLIQLTFGDKGSYIYGSFGAPVASGDDAAQAMAAALELRQPGPEAEFVHRTRIGISQDQVWAGLYGGLSRQTYGVLGRGVNRAARLMTEAQPLQILVSQDIVEVVKTQYRFTKEPLSIKVKDRVEPVLASLLLGWQLPTFSTFSAPLLGREPELAAWQEFLDGVATGAGQIARLEGGRGVGKSHLLAKIAKGAQIRAWRVALGASRFTTLTPWHDVFRALFGLVEDVVDVDNFTPSELHQMANKVKDCLDELNPDWVRRLPLLNDLLGLPLFEEAMFLALPAHERQQLVSAMAFDLLQAWAARQPLLVIIEDAHRLDEASLALVVGLQHIVPHRPIGVIFTHRPALQEENIYLSKLITELAAHPGYALRQLSPEAVHQLVSAQLGAPPSTLLLSLLMARSLGNPLFVQELVRNLRDTNKLFLMPNQVWTLSESLLQALLAANCLTQTAGEYDLLPNASLERIALEIPPSIQSVMLASLALLPMPVVEMLKLASVIGRTFEKDVLAQAHAQMRARSQLSPLSAEELAGMLETLEIAGLLRLRTTSDDPNSMFGFAQHVTQEVIYSTLPEMQKRSFHLAVGQALEALVASRPEMLPALAQPLAEHFTHAYTPDHPDAYARERKLIYLDQAARQAQRFYANQAALRYFDLALREEKRWQWRLGEAEIYHLLGNRTKEEAVLDELRLTPGAPMYELNYQWGLFHMATSQFSQAIEFDFPQALMAAQLPYPNPVRQARCLAKLGFANWEAGHSQNAIERYQQALYLFPDRAATSLEAKQALVDVLNGLGTVHRQLGDFNQARRYYEEALTLAEAAQDALGTTRTFSNLGVIAYHQRHFDEALSHDQAALDLWRKIGYWVGEGHSLGNLGLIARETGAYDKAIGYFFDARAICQATGNREAEVDAWGDLGVCYQELGDLVEAQRCLEQGMSLIQASPNQQQVSEAYLLSNWSLILLDKEELEAAEDLLNKGLQLIRELQPEGKHQPAVFLTYLSKVALQNNRPQQALELAQVALDLRTELKLTDLLVDDLALLAYASLKLGNLAQAVTYAQQTQDLLNTHPKAEFPRHDYWLCYEVWVAAGQADQAQTTLCRAYDLVLTRARKIEDMVLRQSFLERVAINRKIIRAAQEHGCSELVSFDS